MDRRPVTTLDDLFALDERELVAGYQSGLRGDHLTPTATRAFWHGWRTGSVDGHHMPQQDDLRALARLVFRTRHAMAAGNVKQPTHVWNGSIQ